MASNAMGSFCLIGAARGQNPMRDSEAQERVKFPKNLRKYFRKTGGRLEKIPGFNSDKLRIRVKYDELKWKIMCKKTKNNQMKSKVIDYFSI